VRLAVWTLTTEGDPTGLVTRSTSSVAAKPHRAQRFYVPVRAGVLDGDLAFESKLRVGKELHPATKLQMPGIGGRVATLARGCFRAGTR